MSRAVLAPFEAYQKARVTFVQTVAELAQRPQNIEALQSAGKSLNLVLKFDQEYSSMTLFKLPHHETETDFSFFYRRYGSSETSAFG